MKEYDEKLHFFSSLGLRLPWFSYKNERQRSQCWWQRISHQNNRIKCLLEISSLSKLTNVALLSNTFSTMKWGKKISCFRFFILFFLNERSEYFIDKNDEHKVLTSQSIRASLATRCHSPSISFHFFQKYQIKNIPTFLHFLYHINYILLLFK